MSDQSKPTGEWTEDTVNRMFPRCGAKGIADAHKAALAEAKSGGWLSDEALDEYAKVEQEVHQLREQLAALVDALKYYARTADNVKVATDALAKVKE